MTTVSVEAAVAFSMSHLGSAVAMGPGPGGWNRIELVVHDLAGTFVELFEPGGRG